jgi:hypothetical protein
MPAQSRTVDLLVGAFDLNQRRKFELKNAEGEKGSSICISSRSHAQIVKRHKAWLALMRH